MLEDITSLPNKAILSLILMILSLFSAKVKIFLILILKSGLKIELSTLRCLELESV